MDETKREESGKEKKVGKGRSAARDLCYIALFAAIVAVSVATVVMAEDSDAIDKGDVYVAVDGSVNVEFNITEPDNTYYKNTVEWIVEGEKVTSDETAPEDIVKISVTGSNGDYIATITGLQVGTVTGVVLKYTLHSVINGKEHESIDQSLEYTLDVTVLSSPLKEKDDVKFGDPKVGQPISTVSVVEDTSNSDYVYYALNLPKGLQMAPDGGISGTPIESVTDRTITVVATHINSNQVFTKTYTISVAADDDSFSFEVSGASFVNGEQYVALQSDTNKVTLTTKIANTATSIDKVYIIDESGAQEPLSPTKTETYDIPVTGSGEFRVVMVNGDEVKSFGLTVVPIAYDVSTGIGFAPYTTASP